jgi:hypothetical protein
MDGWETYNFASLRRLTDGIRDVLREAKAEGEEPRGVRRVRELLR